ncbi:MULTISPECIES: isoaspartyl peptidase/L-asparaginase family protein [Anaeromyxobacter]|uniref:isoaspartyl peptidase/L-asparaginase family protein n=1 Tax=Anaeromyxobacter TaxID=161492 RepID=UPI001F586177|nr:MULTISPECIES: isoaspartyl peptidase/L-asparaginase family protein [unclassified Anaeromyxobacter]
MPPAASPAIIVHGGAGSLGSDDPASSGGADAPRLEGVRRACEAGQAVLRAGGSALDAVETAVRVLEDDPTYNAGTGATLTAAGDVELDASIMDGETLRCGAVAVVKDVRNPVTLARAVMERSQHVLLAGPGASAFAREAGIPPYENALLVTARQRARWEEARAAAAGTGPAGTLPGKKFGTVGAVARDARGHLAAATSTGGMQLKLPGRVGDTPLIGCGTYADDALAAVSCTGHGERIIQLTLARFVADRVGRGATPMDAAREAIAALGRRVRGEGGVIVVGPRGEVGFAHNTPVMSRAWTTPDGDVVAEL